MKDISQAFFAAYTTMNTIDKWVCPEFNSFWKEIWATTRLLCLAINWAVYDVMPPPIQFIMKYPVSKIAYPEDNYPKNSVGCTYVYSEYLYLFILLIVVFFMIASSQLILEMLTYSQFAIGQLRPRHLDLRIAVKDGTCGEITQTRCQYKWHACKHSW